MMPQTTELDVIRDLTQLFARRAGSRELIEQGLDMLETRLGMQRGTVTLALPEVPTLTVDAPRAVHAAAAADGRGRRQAVESRVLGTGEVAVAPAGNGFGASDSHGEFMTVCVPIVMGHEVVGTLTVDLPGATPEALETEKKVLATMAALLAADARSQRAARQEREELESENRRLLGTIKELFRPDGLVGHSRPMREACQRIHQVSGSRIPVLLRGEAGTGKELVATTIHYHSPRAGRPLIRMSCAALGDDLIESELFGLERPADSRFYRPGRVEEAEGGTLFLDEIGELTPALQIKLLRLVQDGEYERVGSLQTRRADVRLIAATRRDLEGAVRLGTFRQDLYYRINVFPILLPPLRERQGDILLLANHFTALYAERLGKAVRRISTPAINMLMAYHWPGNVRELESCIEHAILMSTDEVIHGHTLPPTLQIPEAREQAAGGTLKQAIHAMERDMIVDALKRFGGNISSASRELGITGRMVRYKIKQLEIDYRGLFSRRAQAARVGIGGSEAA